MKRHTLTLVCLIPPSPLTILRHKQTIDTLGRIGDGGTELL